MSPAAHRYAALNVITSCRMRCVNPVCSEDVASAPSRPCSSGIAVAKAAGQKTDLISIGLSRPRRLRGTPHSSRRERVFRSSRARRSFSASCGRRRNEPISKSTATFCVGSHACFRNSRINSTSLEEEWLELQSSSKSSSSLSSDSGSPSAAWPPAVSGPVNCADIFTTEHEVGFIYKFQHVV